MIRIRDFGEMVRASGILRRIVVPVEKNWHPTDGPRRRGAKAVIDESTAARLSAVVGDGEFSEFAGAAHGAPEGSATTAAALIRRNTPAAAIAVATLACLWVGNRMNQSLPDTVAHAGDNGGSFGEPTAAAGPMFGAGRDPGARGGDPAMNLKNSARVAVLAVTAAVTANGALAGDAVQWRVADGGNGHWYQLKVEPQRRFWELVSDARAVGGHLISVRSEAENNFARAISIGYFVHFGAIQDHTSPTYSEPSSGWTWVSGEPWDWNGWCANQPDNAPWGGYYGQDLARFASASGSCWDDAHSQAQIATINIEATMFEWSADCNSDGIVDYGQCHDGTLPDYNGNNIPDCCEQGVQCIVGNYPAQWRVDAGGNGHWYQRVDTLQRIFWVTAKDRAEVLGGYLACLETPEENLWLWNTVINVGPDSPSEFAGWIGLYQTSGGAEPFDGWTWLTGSALGYLEAAAFDNAAGFGPEQYGCYYRNGYWAAWADMNAGGCWVSDCETSFIIEWSADCNSDGVVDYGQILNGQLADTNTNNIPDCCEPGNNCCLGDIYVNHIVDGGDLGVLLSEWGAVTPTTRSDLNRDGFVDGADLGRLLANWGPCGG